MSKKSRLREPFGKQHGKRAKALYKSASQHVYHIHQSMPSQLNWRESLLLTCQILGLLPNTFATDEKYLLLQLSQKQQAFSQLSAEFLKSTLDFKYFE